MRVRLNLERLRALMAASRLSQNHLAMQLGLSRGHFSDLVNGKYPYPSRRTQERLLEKFGVGFEDLFDIEEDTDEWGEGVLAAFQAAIADRYVVDEEIGRGGMGTVYLARDVKLGRRVAIKVISPEALAGVGAGRFLKEIRRTAQLEHHHILTLFDSGEAVGYPYYVMPYVRGGSLRDLLKNHGRLDVAATLHLVRGVAAALRHAHEARVIHCDIKPENILLSEDHPYLADFGIARVVHSEVLPWRACDELDSSAGTPAYVSPEQATGERDLDRRADVYSLACVVFEMLTGQAPFTGKTTMEIVARRFTKVVPEAHVVSPHVPPEVSAVVRKGMETDRRRRYASAEAFADALDAAQDGVGRTWYRLRAWGTALGDRWRSITSRPRRPATRRWWDGLGRDLAFAVRTMSRIPGFVALAVITIALGIGVNAALFSLVSGILYRPLPYPESDRLVLVREVDDRGGRHWASYLNFADWRAGSPSADGVAALTWPSRTTVLGGAEPVQAPVAAVSRDFFRVAGVQPWLGRWLTDDDHRTGAPPAAVVSHRFWTTQFAGRDALDDVTLRVGSAVVPVVGVMPPGFEMLGAVDIWTSLDRQVPWSVRGNHVLRVVARIASGATPTILTTELNGVAQRIQLEHPGETEAVAVHVTPLREWIVAGARRPLWLLFGASGLVLLVSCTNIASALLARGLYRDREFAIRRSLGAGPWRLARQIFTETTVIVALGGVVAVLLAHLILRLIVSVDPTALPRIETARVEPGTLWFTVGAMAVTALVCGTLPALKLAAHGASDRLTQARLGRARKRGNVWNALVVAQLALTAVLLVGSGLVIRSVWTIVNGDLGFRSDDVLTFTVALPPAKFADGAAVARFHHELGDALRAAPGVERAGMVNLLPLAVGNFVGYLRFPSGETASGSAAHYRLADADYFHSLDIPLRRGRLFHERDAPAAPHAAVIDESMAQRYWPGEDPIGQRFDIRGMDPYVNDWLTIVGVVGEARHWQSDPGTQYTYYINARQRPVMTARMTWVVHSRLDTSTLTRSVSDIVRAIDADVPLEFAPMPALIAESAADRRAVMFVLAGFGLVALGLAAVGTYGVVSYSVAGRRREMGVRLALGATPVQVVRLIVRETSGTIGIGLAVGVVGAVAATRLLRSQLYEISPTDPATLVAAAIVLSATTILASYVPARRAARADPTETIRVVGD